MSDLTKNYAKWISGFTDTQFDIVVEEFIKSVWKISDLNFTDGTNDGGNDIRMYVDNNKLKIQVQVTIQESSFDKKIEKELTNAKENVLKYGYQNRLLFFYSHSISEEKTNHYELIAKEDYDIDLVLIDAKRIASAAKIHESVLKAIHKNYDIPYTNKNILSTEDRMLFDFISFGSNATEIKTQIIQAYITHILYEKEQLPFDEICSTCCSHFKTTDLSFFSKMINNLKNRKIIYELQIPPKTYALSSQEIRRIDLLKNQFLFQEQKLVNDLKAELDKFDVKENTLTVITKIRELLESNFNIDKLEILDRAFKIDSDDNQKPVDKFLKYLKKITEGGSTDKAKLLGKKILSVCKENDILQKLSAGKLFTSLSNPDVIRDYTRQTERLTFIDSHIAFYALCYYYEDTDYDNYSYKAVKDLLSLDDKFEGINFKIASFYLSEIAFHLKDAIYLIPYEEYGLLNDFGNSTNVFYNYYFFLKEESLLEDHINSFKDFIYAGFELTPDVVNKFNYNEIAFQAIAQRLNSLGISVYNGDSYYDSYEDSKRTISELLNKSYRPDAAIANDAKMLSILFDDTISINEPVFITQDHVMLNSRSKLHEIYKSKRLWHCFTPNQFVTHISLINFDINSTTITREIVSLFDDTFNLYKKSHQLLDLISRVINVKDETGRKYAQKIKEFKQEYIFDIKKTNLPTEGKENENIQQPIVEVVKELTRHYSLNKEEGQLKLDDLRTLFTIDEIFDSVIAFFKKQLLSFITNNSLTSDAFNEMDSLISKAVEIKQKNPQN